MVCQYRDLNFIVISNIVISNLRMVWVEDVFCMATKLLSSEVKPLFTCWNFSQMQEYPSTVTFWDHWLLEYFHFPESVAATAYRFSHLSPPDFVYHTTTGVKVVCVASSTRFPVEHKFWKLVRLHAQYSRAFPYDRVSLPTSVCTTRT